MSIDFRWETTASGASGDLYGGRLRGGDIDRCFKGSGFRDFPLSQLYNLLEGRHHRPQCQTVQ